MGKPLNVLFLQPQPCIRAYKYAEGLKNTGDINLTFGYMGKTLTEFYGLGDELFDRWVKISDPKDLKNGGLVSLIKSNDFDIIHSHNAPDYMTVAAILANSDSEKDVPVIHDNHDVLTMRQTTYGAACTNTDIVTSEELIANRLSDARIHVTSGLEDYVRSKYGNALFGDMTFMNYVPGNLVPEVMKPKLSSLDGGTHIVYEGSVDGKVKDSHYDLVEIFRSIVNKGFHLHFYTTKPADNYLALSKENPLFHFHGKLDSSKLMSELTQYDFGWAGFNANKNKVHLKATFANKVFEYISAGLPVISFPHETQKRFLEETGLGMVIPSVDALPSALNDSGKILAMKSNVLNRRKDFTVEKNIGKVWDFYNELADKFKKINSPRCAVFQ